MQPYPPLVFFLFIYVLLFLIFCKRFFFCGEGAANWQWNEKKKNRGKRQIYRQTGSQIERDEDRLIDKKRKIGRERQTDRQRERERWEKRKRGISFNPSG